MAVIKAGMKHAIKAVGGDLHIIEVQIGDELTEEEIEQIDWKLVKMRWLAVRAERWGSAWKHGISTGDIVI